MSFPLSLFPLCSILCLIMMVTSGSVLGATIKNYCSTHSWNRKARLSIYWHRLTLLLCCFLCCLQVTDSPAERPALLKVAMTSMFLASWKYMFLTPFSTFGISDAAVWDPRITRWLWRMTKCHIGEIIIPHYLWLYP